jgi:hypothetical protein
MQQIYLHLSLAAAPHAMSLISKLAPMGKYDELVGNNQHLHLAHVLALVSWFSQIRSSSAGQGRSIFICLPARLQCQVSIHH